MTMLWRLLPVALVTIRQMAGGKTVRLITVLSCLPALFMLIFVLRPWQNSADAYFLNLLEEFVIPTLLPIVILLPATAAFGDELEDGTLPFIYLKPVTRLRIVLEKFLAVLCVTIPAFFVGMVVTSVVATQGPNATDIWLTFRAILGAGAMAALLLGAVFIFISLVIPRALLAGIIYIFAWESLLGRFLPGVQSISSREYTVRVFNGLLNNDMPAVRDASLTMLVVAVIALVLATLRLRQMQID